MALGPQQTSIAPKAWVDRSNTMGYLPGKGSEQLTTLRAILSQLPKGTKDGIEVTLADNSIREVPVDQLCGRQLTRGGFVYRIGDEWRAVEPVERWQESANDLLLAMHIQGNVKFFGELLAGVHEDTRTSDLLKLAESYGLFWTSPDQIHRRIGWLQSLGLLERWGLNKLVVTDKGRDFLATVSLVTQEEAGSAAFSVGEEIAELPEEDDLVAAAVQKAKSSGLRARKTIVGYVPRGQKSVGRPSDESQTSVTDAVRNYIELLGQRISSDELLRKATKELNQKKSSFTSSMHTFKHMGIVEMVALNVYGVTEVGRHVLSPGNEVDLVRFLHARFRFVGEVLVELSETTTVSELTRVADERYGLGQLDHSEIRTRLGFLLDAGLVQRIDWTRYKSTQLGLDLARQLPLEVPDQISRDPSSAASSSTPETAGSSDRRAGRTSEIEDVKAQVLRTSRLKDSNSEDFERAVARAFTELGFRAEHIGGGGKPKTDVLVTADISEAERYVSIIEAKASASGTIDDDAIKFDALKDHKRVHAADYGVVVGPGFSKRVKDWAAANMFVLVTADELVDLVDKQQHSPLSIKQLKRLFEPAGSPLDDMEQRYEAEEYVIRLKAKIVELLYEEANDEDPIPDGLLSLDNIHYALRKEFTPRPTREQVQSALSFLCSPALMAIHQEADKYRLTDTPSNMARRLLALGDRIAKSLEAAELD